MVSVRVLQRAFFSQLALPCRIVLWLPAYTAMNTPNRLCHATQPAFGSSLPPLFCFEIRAFTRSSDRSPPTCLAMQDCSLVSRIHRADCAQTSLPRDPVNFWSVAPTADKRLNTAIVTITNKRFGLTRRSTRTLPLWHGNMTTALPTSLQPPGRFGSAG
jgi:hypothetical protein